MKNNVVRKLTSRKFWAAMANFVSMMVVFAGGSQDTAVQVTALIMAGATVISYIVGEGLTDAANIGLFEAEAAEGITVIDEDSVDAE